MNCGSSESLQRLWRCGWSPNAFQIRCTADWVRPTSAAIERVDQCVASLGVVSSVLTITSSTLASVIVRGCPGRGSSVSPSKRCSANRLRHLRHRVALRPRVARRSRCCSSPSAASNTIRERSASACALVRRRDHDSNCSRSSSVNSIGTANGEGIPSLSCCVRVNAVVVAVPLRFVVHRAGEARELAPGALAPRVRPSGGTGGPRVRSPAGTLERRPSNVWEFVRDSRARWC